MPCAATSELSDLAITKDFESKLAEQKKQIEALTAGLQKVSAQ